MVGVNICGSSYCELQLGWDVSNNVVKFNSEVLDVNDIESTVLKTLIGVNNCDSLYCELQLGWNVSNDVVKFNSELFD